MTLVNASCWKPQPLDWLIPGVLSDSLTLISGEAKMGKSLLAGNMVRSLINQTEFLNVQPKKGSFRVAWMGYDINWQQEFINNFNDISDFVWFNESIHYKNLEKWQALSKDAHTMGINLLVVDYLCGLAPALDLNYSHLVDEAFLPLKNFIEATGIPILLLHHANKTGSGRAANSVLIEAKARLIGRISGSQNRKAKTIEFIGNEIETHKITVLIKPKGVEFDAKKKVEKYRDSREEVGVLMAQARIFKDEAPFDAKKSARAAGKWLVSKGLSGTNDAGRTKINKMIEAQLLTRAYEKGPLVPGPKLLY